MKKEEIKEVIMYLERYKKILSSGEILDFDNPHDLMESYELESFIKSLHPKEQINVRDEDIESEAWNRYGEKNGGQYHADRPYNRKCFINGAKWMRDKSNNSIITESKC